MISDSNAMQAELQSGRVDIAPLPTSLSPDSIRALGKDPNLKVEQFPGSNLNHLTFNTKEAPLDNVKVRQAIAYAIDRQAMIEALLLGQGTDCALNSARRIVGLHAGHYLSIRSGQSEAATRRSGIQGSGELSVRSPTVREGKLGRRFSFTPGLESARSARSREPGA